MSDLPAGWEWSTIDGASQVVLGQSPPGTSYNSDGIGVPFFQGKAEFRATTAEVRKWTTEPKLASQGDVLLSVRAPVGATNFAPTDCSVGRGLAALRAKGDIDQRFVFWFLRQAEGRLAEMGTGTTFTAITGSQLKTFPIPVPPVLEQRRIVAAIEEHLSRLDVVDSALNEAQRRAPLIVQSQRELEFASERDLHAIEDLASEHKNALAIGPFGSNLKVSDYRKGGVPLVFVRDIRRREFGGEGTRFVDEAKATELASHLVRNGDVLVTKMGDPPGDVALYRGPDAVITADCIKITPSTAVSADFLAEALQTDQAQRQIAAITKGVAQRKVSLGRFRKQVAVPLPDAGRQREIVERIAIADQAARRLGESIELAQARSSALRRSILAAAFSGQLVPQDPADEPAAAVLKRVAAELSAGKPSRRKKAAS